MSQFPDPSNSQKTPLSQALPKIAQGGGRDAAQSLGKTLPCTVYEVTSPWIVTVNFEVQSGQPWTLPKVKVPVLAPPYVAYPIQVGDAGLFLSADVRLGQLSGLGGGTPALTDTVANLSAGAFIWLGNTDQTTIDDEAVVVWDNLVVSQDSLAFFGGAKTTQQEVTGALSLITDPNAQAVITSILNALGDAGYNLIDDETT